MVLPKLKYSGVIFSKPLSLSIGAIEAAIPEDQLDWSPSPTVTLVNAEPVGGIGLTTMDITG